MDRSVRKSVVRKIYKNATTLHAYLARWAFQSCIVIVCAVVARGA
jgi:hypothetical protein